jgi:hypothetical protein
MLDLGERKLTNVTVKKYIYTVADHARCSI